MAVSKDYLVRLLKAKWANESLDDYQIDARLDILDEVTHPLLSEFMHRSWSHQPLYMVLHGRLKCPSIHELGQAIDIYLANEFLRAPPLDWMLADAIVFSETNATAQTIGAAKWHKDDGSPSIPIILLKVLFGLFCWAMWAALAVAAYVAHPLVLAALVVLTIISQISKRNKARKVAELMQSMADVYGGLDNQLPSWRNVYSLMEESRAKGAKWPTPLYRLVEKSISQW